MAGDAPESAFAGRALNQWLDPLFAASDFWQRILSREREAPGGLLDGLEADLPRPLTPDSLTATLAAMAGGATPLDRAACSALLRRFKYRMFLRASLRELHRLTGIEESLAEYSAIAEASIAFAWRWACADASRAFGIVTNAAGVPVANGDPSQAAVVFGMGKLGGAELNYSSDVDLVIAYAPEAVAVAPPAGLSPAALHRFDETPQTWYARVTRTLVALLSETTEHGFCYRVDLDLRPEGNTGPLVNGAQAMIQYYESWGRTWERAAWIKARPVAGSTALGEAILEQMRPFVYRRSLDYAVADEIRGVKALIDRQRLAQAAATRGSQAGPARFNVKLGEGGIREIEFFVQTHQLIHGGREPLLRYRGTLGALRRLYRLGLVRERVFVDLSAAYHFLRRVENRVQMLDERQTHDLPRADEPAFARVTQGLVAASGPPFETLLAQHVRAVRHAFAAAMPVPIATTDATGEPGTDAHDPRVLVPLPAHAENLLVADLDLPEAPDWARAARFADTERALHVIRRLRGQPGGPYREGAAASLWTMGRRLFAAVLESPDPEAALLGMAEFVQRWGRDPSLSRLIDGRPGFAHTLADVLAASDIAGASFIRRRDAVETLWAVLTREPRQSAATLATRVAQVLAGTAATAPGDTPGDERAHTALCRIREDERIRVLVNDLAGLLPTPAVWTELSTVADVLVACVLARASAATVARLGPPPVDAQGEPVPLVVVGLGKLGGSELGYASDLDLLFVYGDAADPAAAADWFARLAQKFIHWLSHQGAGGRLYSIDTRLRPSGSQGPLVVSLAALERYHEGEAALWERQALSRARVIAWTTGAAGDDDPVREPPVVGRLKRALDRSVYERPLPSDAGAQFADMRRRLEAHNIRPRPAPCDAETDIKYGAGGLLDIEFLAQYGALTVGAAGQAGQAGQATWAALQAGNTRETLSALGTVGFLPLTDAAFLADAYDRLRRLESRVVLARGCEAPSRTGVNDARWAVVARRMGYTAPAPSQAVATLWTDIALMRARVRELFKTVVG